MDIMGSSTHSYPGAMGTAACASVDIATMSSTGSLSRLSDKKMKTAMPIKKRSVFAADIDIDAPSPEDYYCRSNTPPARKKRSMSVAAATIDKSPFQRHVMGSEYPKSNRMTKTFSMMATRFEMKASELSFPVVLMGIMSAPQNEEFITFLSDEQSFVIVRPDALAKHVLPVHFEGSAPTLDQFLDLLAIWEFEKVDCPQYPQVDVFKHPMFRKGDWEACLQMELPHGERQAKSPTYQDQAVDYPPTEDIGHRAPPAHAEPQQPSSPLRELSAADAAAGYGLSAVTARSVTPPEIVTSPLSGMRRHHHATAAPPSLTRDSPTSQWMVQSAMLEQMIMATAETRRRLSGFSGSITASPSLDEMMHCPELQSIYPQGMEGSSATMYANVDSAADAHPSLEDSMNHQAMNMRYPNLDNVTAAASIMPIHSRKRSFSAETKLSDAQVQVVTNDVVSAAMAALNGGKQHHRHAPSDINANTVISPTSSSSRLDVMTEAFLERSNARRMQSRPAGILGPSSMSLSTTRALLTQQQYFQTVSL